MSYTENLWVEKAYNNPESFESLGNNLSKLRVNVSRKFLETKLSVKSYDELMAKDSKKIIEAVQVLLKDRWYNIWNIDGVLKEKSSLTSRTMEAIRKFQEYAWIYPADGLPWPKTIEKLLEEYKPFFHADCEELNYKNSLSDQEVNKAVEYILYSHDYLALNWLEKITNKQAKELWKVSWLYLNWLKNINDNQVFYLSNLNSLGLNWLKNIADNQIKMLSKVKFLYLDWLTSVTDKQIDLLVKNKTELSLKWLKRITDTQAKSLWKTYSLFLDWLEEITDKQVLELSKDYGERNLRWLKKITDKQAEIFAKSKCVINLNNDILSPKQKEILGK